MSSSLTTLNPFCSQAPLVFFVNGKKVVENEPDPECTLLSYLRNTLRLCGTKLGCGEGGCGACTVMISRILNRTKKTIKHVAVNACLVPVCAVHGMSVTTVEGIGSTRTKLHPVQERIAKAHGSQCGFCTPGIVMSMYALLRSSPTRPTMKDMEVAFQGNLCRCTGYRPIIEGYRTFTKEGDSACGMGSKCCKIVNGTNGVTQDVHGKTDGKMTHDQAIKNRFSDQNGLNGCSDNQTKTTEKINGNDPCLNRQPCSANQNSTDQELFNKNDFAPYDASQEPIFPPELMVSDKLGTNSIVFRSKTTQWFQPTSLDEILTIKSNYPNAKLVVGNTEVGIEMKFKHCNYPVLVQPILVPELTNIEISDHGVRVGASVTLMDMQEALQSQIELLAEEETRLYRAMVQMLHYFAGKQIRNVASIGGNIMTGSPISDMVPILSAAGIELEVASKNRGSRCIKMGEGFFIGYRRNIIETDEVLVSLTIPRTGRDQYFLAYKQAKRREDDIAIVNMAINVQFQPDTDFVAHMQLAFGGMAPTVALTPKSCSKIIGMRWDRSMIEVLNGCLIDELPLSPSAPGGMILYRRSLTLSLVFKAFLEIGQHLEQYVLNRTSIAEREKSGASLFHALDFKSCQLYQKIPGEKEQRHAVGQPKVHASAFKQAAGEAIYIDDIPYFENELYLARVISSKSHARIISIDETEALSLPGVHAFFSAKDLSGPANMFGAVDHDEEIFISDTVTSQGQTIGVIVADSQDIAQKAARMVKVVYKDIKPIIVSIKDAIANKSYFSGFPKMIYKGDLSVGFSEADVVIEGECRMGGQEHFYLETHAAVAVPKDIDELEVFCSSQHPTEVQKFVANMLGVSASRIVTRVKRLGGGFGGKESRGLLVALPVAFAAFKLGRPVRCMLDRFEDMGTSGTRHPFYFKYKAGATKDGLITAIDLEIYNNGGYSKDLSEQILDRAIYHCSSSYKVPNFRVKGWVCRTNLPSNTAFRGFGAPQGMFAGENIVRELAKAVGKTEVEMMELNMYKESQITHTNQFLNNCNVRRCWTECFEQAKYREAVKQIEEFNAENRWRKRGISMVPITYGVGFGAPFLNQSGALVHVYTDGSVLLSHGGTEMGQGLHTKMIQVASKALDISSDLIHISETSTDKVPNTSSTAASVGSDLNGMAVLEACSVIRERLAPYRMKDPNIGWKGWVTKAYFDRVSLSSTGFYKTPDLGYDFEKNSGNMCSYYTYGAACSVVEIDCLTGDHQVIRTDIVMDLGESLNPAIDVGQVEGAFMQGYGLFTLEEMIYSPDGTVISRGPGVYKIPGFADIPGELNVSLLRGSSNPKAVYSSKAVGEPPLSSALSVFFAIKNAIYAARKEEHLADRFDLVSPATCARIRIACSYAIIEKLDNPEQKSFTPWNVMP